MNACPVGAQRDRQPAHAAQRLRHVASDADNLGLGQEVVRRTHRPLPHGKKPVNQLAIPLLDLDDPHVGLHGI